MKRIWDKVNDEWIYEYEEMGQQNEDHETRTEDDKNLVLLISSLNNKAHD